MWAIIHLTHRQASGKLENTVTGLGLGTLPYAEDAVEHDRSGYRIRQNPRRMEHKRKDKRSREKHGALRHPNGTLALGGLLAPRPLLALGFEFV
jgi:hypothetical protein